MTMAQQNEIERPRMGEHMSTADFLAAFTRKVYSVPPPVQEVADTCDACRGEGLNPIGGTCSSCQGQRMIVVTR
jgi:hypothetical protein